MRTYLDLLDKILTKGKYKGDRTGTGTYSLFGEMLRFDLSEGFPIVTTKKIHYHSVLHELLWMISGDTNIKYLQENKVRIWNEWANKKGELGPVYGKQWRSWEIPRKTEWEEGERRWVDQLEEAIFMIKENPNSRRILVSAWNPSDVPQMALPPCHLLYQFYVNENKLSCMMTQRSCDAFLGLPFNIASYATLTHMIASLTDLKVGDLIVSLGDTHLYSNHIDQAKLQLQREPLELPSLLVRKQKTIDNFTADDVVLANYKYHPAIKAQVAV